MKSGKWVSLESLDEYFKEMRKNSMNTLSDLSQSDRDAKLQEMLQFLREGADGKDEGV